MSKPDNKFRLHQIVYHDGPTGNMGEVEIVNAWGSFYACRTCFRDMPKDKICHNTLPLHVPGGLVYDCLCPDGKVRSISEVWLK